MRHLAMEQEGKRVKECKILLVKILKNVFPNTNDI